ncbi:hypothetical protein [Rufibacter latericius]|uniref:Uncharacterized protein n=1 Tax=Rufibacter latericius TaxID=2487040 RepID=A0A3M9MET8_9BACT|nr:hypothetical protein [Rufibacter latericius]RNI24080.1 hypothetical protein EFB08_17045 [Rufibacter latericius]
MKTLHKLVHLSLIVALSLASMGFRVAVSQCSGGKGTSIGFFAEPGCCCKKASKKPMKSCNDLSCVMQRGVASHTNLNAPAQQVAKVAKEPGTYPDFTEHIRPSILETIPHFTLPPPVPGRLIGILHQTFII